jgi:hypothetical protein
MIDVERAFVVLAYILVTYSNPRRLKAAVPKTLTKMKTTLFPTALLFFILLSCRPGPGIEQVPPDIIASVPCPTLYARILELFPEHNKNSKSKEVLFSDTVQKKVVLTKESDVYVTYLSEGAGYRNTFGWYSYNKNTPPTSTSQIELHVLFPDVSHTVLKAGDRLKLSDTKFQAGTVIGFFLIVGGWQDGTIDYSKPKIYTDQKFNPNESQQHILFQEKTCGDMVLAFEDLAGDGGTSDQDFNDILFTVSDNNSDKINTAFEHKSIASW